jgi:AcrR family transcriptional regulator
VQAAREVFAESGVEACMEQIASRAGVGVGTVYRRFPSKDVLIEELINILIEQLCAAADIALAADRSNQESGNATGNGLGQFLVAFGECFVEHRRYIGLMLSRTPVVQKANVLRAQIAELTDNARVAGVINAEASLGDVMALIWAMRGLIELTAEQAPDAWRRHIDIHLAGLSSPAPLSRNRVLTDRQLSRISPHLNAH